MNIGVITYKQYDENVLLDKNFMITELFNIILNDSDFVRFEIFDKNGKLMLSTYYRDVELQRIYLNPVKVKKDVEVTGITYDAYCTPSTIRRIKVRWIVDGAPFRVKKGAVEYADRVNRRETLKIEKFINL
jgi:hypothetical protein